MKVIILGCGRMGSRVAADLARGGHHVTVIDRNADAFRRLDPNFEGATVVGTGIDEDVLRAAGIAQADAFVATSDKDSTNIMAAQVARTVFGVPKVLVRISDPNRVEIYRHLGLEPIATTTVGAQLVKQALITGQQE